MKSLRESLFDSNTQTTTESLFDKDLIRKNIKFGDLFEFEYSTPFKTQPVIDKFHVTSMRYNLKVKGKDSFDVIVNGLKKIILETPIQGDADKKWLEKTLTDRIERYLTDFPDDSTVRISFYREDPKSAIRKSLITQRDCNLLDDEIHSMDIFIQLSVGLYFKHK